jgi:hypothetical protein
MTTMRNTTMNTFATVLSARVLPLGLSFGLIVTAASTLPGCRAARIASARQALKQATGEPSGIAEVKQLEYASPEASLAALRSAAETMDPVLLIEALGPNWRGLLSGDPAERDRQRRAFLARLDGSTFETVDGGAVLMVGRTDDPDRFPFAVPLRKHPGGWQWDTDAGIIEVQVRRIGRNELDTIESLRTIAVAQLAFRDRDVDGDGQPNFAASLMGSETRKDALHRPIGPVETALIGPALASADATDGRAGATPFHGYLFAMLPMQGAGAAGGAKDFRDASRRYMGGFAVLATPAEYRVSGVTCFLMGPDGTVYEKDLGDDTATATAKITSFDPTGWAKVQ